MNREGGPHLLLIDDLEYDHHGHQLIEKIKVRKTQKCAAHQKAQKRDFDHMSIGNDPLAQRRTSGAAAQTEQTRPTTAHEKQIKGEPYKTLLFQHLEEQGFVGLTLYLF